MHAAKDQYQHPGGCLIHVQQCFTEDEMQCRLHALLAAAACQVLPPPSGMLTVAWSQYTMPQWDDGAADASHVKPLVLGLHHTQPA